MLAPERAPGNWCRRIPLVTIDRVVVARLGQTRILGNAQPAVFNRQIAMYLAKHVGGWSTTLIGRFYNGRDQSTVCYAVKKIEVLRNSQPQVEELLATLEGEIGSELQGKRAASDNAVTHPAGQGGGMLFTDEFLDLLLERIRFRGPPLLCYPFQSLANG